MSTLYRCRWHADSNDSTLSQFRTHTQILRCTRKQQFNVLFIAIFTWQSFYWWGRFVWDFRKNHDQFWSYWKQLPWLHSINTIIQRLCNGSAVEWKSTGFLMMPMPLPISSSILFSIDSIAFCSSSIYTKHSLNVILQ